MNAPRRRRTITAAMLALGLLAACGDDADPVEPGEETPNPPGAVLTVTSADFEAGATVPVQFTCDGENVSPSLVWSGAPDGTAEYALLLTDPDAPGGTFTHWVVIHIPAIVTELQGGEVPPEADEVAGSFGEPGYGGPCPPEGDDPHRYRFTVYALERVIAADADTSLEDVTNQIEDAAVAQGTLEALYGR